MAVALPFLMYASAGVAAYGAYQQGQAAQAAATFNEVTSIQNAELARREARTQAAQTHRENMLRLGAIQAAQGASGGSPEGSVLDVIADVARQGELEKQYQIFQGEAAARGYKNTGTLDAFRGEQAANAGYLRAGSELLSGGVSATREANRLNRT